MCEQHARDMTRAAQRATERAEERAEEQLKERLNIDKAKIELLDVELARTHLEKEKCEQALAEKDTALATTES